MKYYVRWGLTRNDMAAYMSCSTPQEAERMAETLRARGFVVETGQEPHP